MDWESKTSITLLAVVYIINAHGKFRAIGQILKYREIFSKLSPVAANRSYTVDRADT